MPGFSSIAAFFRPRWVRAIAITLLCILAFASISAAGGCVFYLNGSKTILLLELTIWTWLLLLFVFVARKWGRVLLAIAALAVPLMMPRCILMLHPVARVGLYLQMAARAVHAGVAGSQGAYPKEMPSSAIPLKPLVEGQYELHYAAFRDAATGTNNHFRIEAVRRHCLCRALKNLTIFDDGTIYSTDENRAATASDTLFYRPPGDAQAR